MSRAIYTLDDIPAYSLDRMEAVADAGTLDRADQELVHCMVVDHTVPAHPNPCLWKWPN